MDKPFLSFEKQIDKLVNEYNLLINDRDFAISALSSMSYFDLVYSYKSIYFINDKYVNGTSIEQLVFTHRFNKDIQGTLMKYSTYAENSFKNILANVIAERFSENRAKYLNISNYTKSRNIDHRKKLKNLLTKLNDYCDNCQDAPTIQYRLHSSNIPPWILFRNISFSNATDIFQFLNQPEKDYFFSFFNFTQNNLSYPEKVEIFSSSLRLVRKFRNHIAHNLDFMTYRECSLKKSANKIFANTLLLRNECNNAHNNVWAMVLAIILLLNSNYLAYNFLAELNSFLVTGGPITDLYCSVTGIPLDYESRIKKYQSTLGFN